MKKKFHSLLYKILIKYSRYASLGVWKSAWDWSVSKYKGPITFKLHGESVLLNNGNLYPYFKSKFYTYNDPLLELVFQSYKSKSRPVNFIDVGAATGDTMLFIFERCPNMVNYYYCIDGDEEFFVYLKNNLRNYKNGKLIKALLTDHNQQNEKSLVRTHLGTASSQGDKSEQAFTLDELLSNETSDRQIDIIKTDVDGLDGKVIGGAEKIIARHQPAVIFEWHPILYRKTGNNINTPFTKLGELGYSRFVFYNKFGKFSHFLNGVSDTDLSLYADLCLRNNYETDWHYDVIALHEASNISSLELAEMGYTKS